MLKKLLYENTFNQIFTQHYTRLYLYAYHLTNDAEASRDIVSDVFAKLWEDIKHIKQENVSGYLTTTVRNRCIDHFRHQQVEIQYTKEYFAEVDTFYTDYTEAMRQDIFISKMLDKLPAMTRHILEECYLARKTYQQVADEMNISPNTVKKHISKSLKMLKELFGSEKDLPNGPDFTTETYII